MEFAVQILSGGKNYRIKVKRVFEAQTFERYEIAAGAKSVIVRTNINLINQKKLIQTKIQWKLEQGEIINTEAFVSTIRAIEHHFEQLYDMHPHLKFNKPR